MTCGLKHSSEVLPRLFIFYRKYVAVNSSKQFKPVPFFPFVGPGSSVGIATELRAGRSGDRIPVGGEIFRTRPDRHWGSPSLLYNGYRVFPGGKVRSGRETEPSLPSSAAVKKE